MKFSIVLVLSLLASSGYADVYNYRCDLIGKKVPLKIDDGKMLLTWQGKQYNIVSAGGNSPFDKNYECAKSGGLDSLNRISASISGTSAGIRLPRGGATW